MTTLGREETITTLIVGGSRTEATLQAWEDELNRIKAQHTYDTSESHLESSISIPDGLNILAKSSAYHNSRARHLKRPTHRLIDLILAHLTPRKSTVTQDWHLKRCLAEVEQELPPLHEDLTTAEELRTYSSNKHITSRWISYRWSRARTWRS